MNEGVPPEIENMNDDRMHREIEIKNAKTAEKGREAWERKRRETNTEGYSTGAQAAGCYDEEEEQ